MTDTTEAPELRGGIDLGGTKIEAIVVDADNKVLGSARHPTPISGTPADVAAEMAQAITEAAEGAGTTTEKLAGGGSRLARLDKCGCGDGLECAQPAGWEGAMRSGPS